MAGTTRPRRKYRPRAIAANPLALAIRRAGRIPAAEIDQVMQITLDAFQALREGVASEDQWCVLASGVELGLSIEKDGVVRGLHGHLTAAETALAEIGRRARADGEWRPVALHLAEIEVLDTFVWIHRTQLENVSEGEWRRAHAAAVGRVRAAGGRVIESIRELEQQALPLED